MKVRVRGHEQLVYNISTIRLYKDYGAGKRASSRRKLMVRMSKQGFETLKGKI